MSLSWAIHQRLIRADGVIQADDRGETRSIQAGLSARRRSIPGEGAFDVGAGSYCASPPFRIHSTKSGTNTITRVPAR